MTRLLNVVPAWAKLILALAGTLVTVTLAYAQLKSDITANATEFRGEVNLLKQQDAHTTKSIDEIKEMLEKEFERHHPRK